MTAVVSAHPSHKVELVLAQLESLPALAPIAVRLLELTAQPDADLREITRVIETDAALSARLLALLARADRGVDRRNATVDRAVALLGVPTVRQVVIAAKVVEAFGGESRGLPRGEFWKHCLSVACGARALAVTAGQPERADEAFVCGLLHDLGKIALDAAVTKSYERVVRDTQSRPGNLLDIERAVLGTDHTVAGKRLAERWRLPTAICECVWLHHLPPEALPPGIGSARVIGYVWLADLIARMHHFGYSGNAADHASLNDAAASVGLKAAAVSRVIAELPGEIAERAAWIGIDDLDRGELYVGALAESSKALADANHELAARNRRLERTVGYFAAATGLYRDCTPRGSPEEACATAAAALAAALAPAAVVVYLRDESAGGIHCGACIGADQPATTLFIPDQQPAGTPDEHQAAAAALLGTPLTPAPACAGPIIDAHRATLGSSAIWLLPLLCERRWVAGALLTPTAERISAARGERSEIESLSLAAGALIAHAVEHARSQRLGESLAWAQQKLASAQGELALTRSLAMTAEMAAGAAHELNTPLAIISGRAQLLQARASDSATASALGEIAKNARRASDIIADLLAFAEPGETRPEAVDVSAMIREIVADWPDDALSQRNFRTEVPSAIVAHCDRSQLRGAIIELLRNAVDATSAGSGNIVVNSRGEASDESVVIEVIDDGRGMDAAVRERAFDPFFSHRPAGRGRGMGLSHAQRWMRANGGDISLHANPQGGTIARARLRPVG